MNTQQSKAVQVGRKISSAKEAGERKNPVHTQDREQRSSESRKSQHDRPRHDEAKKEHSNQNRDHKKPHHHKPKQGLIAGLVAKLKAIFGIKKEEKKKHFYKNRNHRGNFKPRNRRP